MIETRLGVLLTGIVTARLLVACGGASVADAGNEAGAGGSGVGGASGGSGTGGAGGSGTGGGVAGASASGGTGGTGVAGGSAGVGGGGGMGGALTTPVVALGCGGDSSMPLLAEGLELPEPVDFLAVYTGRLEEPTHVSGTQCGGAMNPAACATAYATLLANHTPPLSAPPLSLPSLPGFQAHVGWTRGDEVGLVLDNVELAELLGPIDTPNEALLAFYLGGYAGDCNQLYEYAGGYLMSVTSPPVACQGGYSNYSFQVTTEGAVSMTGVGQMLPHGCVGRRPRGLALSVPHGNSATGCYYARIAELEAAAVIAFELMLAELHELGAPLPLLRRVEQARGDEVRHARLMATLAGRYGAKVTEPRAPARRTPTLLEMALENVGEGCVRETWGALTARYQSQTADSVADRLLWGEVADDEARHAELSWDLHAWFTSQLSAAEQLEVEAARQRAWDELLRELDAEPDGEVQRLAGVPSRSTALALARDLSVHLRDFNRAARAA